MPQYDGQGNIIGTVAFYTGMKIALFDVADVSHPVELFKETIGDRGTDSELLYNHKALLFSREKNLLALPITVMEVQGTGQTGGDERVNFPPYARSRSRAPTSISSTWKTASS